MQPRQIRDTRATKLYIFHCSISWGERDRRIPTNRTAEIFFRPKVRGRAKGCSGGLAPALGKRNAKDAAVFGDDAVDHAAAILLLAPCGTNPIRTRKVGSSRKCQIKNDGSMRSSTFSGCCATRHIEITLES